MPAGPGLSHDEISVRLAALPNWNLQNGRLVRVARRRDFRTALQLVQRIADTADEQNHHPDVSIHWNEITFTLWPHAVGGLTERDFRLARAIEPILADPAN